MRSVFLATFAVSAVLAGAAAAQDMSALFANTINMTHADGSVTKLHFQQGGTYDFTTASGVTGGGAWAMEGDQFCTTRLTPAPAPKMCRATSERHIGDKWEEDTPQGKVSYEMVAGH